MALGSKCGSCGGTFFEIKTVEPRGSRYKQIFVQCGKCGVPVGVVDYYNVGSLLKEQEDRIKKLERDLQQVKATASNIDHNLAQLAQHLLR